MILTVTEHDRHYRLQFSFMRDVLGEERYSMCLPKAESPAELAIILADESHVLRQAIMRHVRERCGGHVHALTYPSDEIDREGDD